MKKNEYWTVRVEKEFKKLGRGNYWGWPLSTPWKKSDVKRYWKEGIKDGLVTLVKVRIEEVNTSTPVIPAAEIDEALEALDLINTTHFDTSCEDCNKIRSVLNKMRGV